MTKEEAEQLLAQLRATLRWYSEMRNIIDQGAIETLKEIQALRRKHKV